MGVGYQEILLVLILTLIVVGPQRLPQVAYQIGRAVRTMQTYARVVRDEFKDEMKYFENEVSSLKGEMDNVQASLREADSELKQQQAEFEKDVRTTTQSVDEAAQSVNRSAATGASSGTRSERRSNVVALPAREKGGSNGVSSARPAATPDSEKKDDEPPAPPMVF